MYNIVVTKTGVSVGLDKDNVTRLTQGLGIDHAISPDRLAIRNCDIVSFLNTLALCKYGGTSTVELPVIQLGPEPCTLHRLSNEFMGCSFRYSYNGLNIKQNATAFDVNVGDIIAKHPREFAAFITTTKLMDLLQLQQVYCSVNKKIACKSVSGAYTTPIIVRHTNASTDMVDIFTTLSSIPAITGEISIPMLGNDPITIPINIMAPDRDISVQMENDKSPLIPVFNTMRSTLTSSRSGLLNNISHLDAIASADIENIKKTEFDRAVTLIRKSKEFGWNLVAGDSNEGGTYLVYPHRIYADRFRYQGKIYEFPDELRETFWVENITVRVTPKFSIHRAWGCHPHRSSKHADPVKEAEESNELHTICIGDLQHEPIEKFVLIPEQMRCVSVATAFEGYPVEVLKHLLGSDEVDRTYRAYIGPCELKEEGNCDDDCSRCDDAYDREDVDFEVLGLGEASKEDWYGILLDIVTDPYGEHSRVYSTGSVKE